VAFLIGCARGASEGEQFQLWAKYASQKAREGSRAGVPGSEAEEIGRLQRRLRISDEELLRIARRAEAEKWAESERCRPASDPYHQNGLLLSPQPFEPLVGRPTPKACRDRREGVAIVGAVVDAEGIAREATVLKGLDPELDERALATVRESRWYAAMLCGRPVSVHFTMAVPFRLESCGGHATLPRVAPGSEGTEAGIREAAGVAGIQSGEVER